MPKIIKGAPGLMEKVKNFVGGGSKEKKETDADRVNSARISGNSLAAELKSIIFAQGKLEDTKTDESQIYGDMETTRNALVKLLEQQDTIFDDIKEIDSVLHYAARSLKDAVAKGSPGEAEWSMRALCYGVMYLRDNIPEHMADRKKEIQKKRIKYMQNYLQIIQDFEMIDDKKRQIDDLNEVIREKTEELNKYKDELKELWNTEKGQRLYGSLKSHENNLKALTDEENAFRRKLRNGATLDHALKLDRARLEQAYVDIDTARKSAEVLRGALTDPPMYYNKDAMVEQFVRTAEDLNRDLAESLATARRLEDELEKQEAALDNILNGEDAQVLAIEDMKFMDEILTEDLTPVNPRADREVQNKMRQIQKMVEQSKAAQENSVKNDDKEVLPDFTTSFHTEAQTDTQENVQLNINGN